MYHPIDIYVILLREATGSAATLSGVMVLTSGAISTMDCYLPPAHNAKGESRWGEQNPTLFILFIYIYVFGYCLPQSLIIS